VRAVDALIFAQLKYDLTGLARVKESRMSEPTGSVIDTQSVKTSIDDLAQCTADEITPTWRGTLLLSSNALCGLRTTTQGDQAAVGGDPIERQQPAQGVAGHGDQPTEQQHEHSHRSRMTSDQLGAGGADCVEDRSKGNVDSVPGPHSARLDDALGSPSPQ
jgi:hypothetical protein